MAYPQEASDGLSVSDGGRAPPPTCLGDIFVGGLHKNPEAPAVISVSQPATHLMELLSAPTKHRDERDYLSWSYAQMEEASHQLCPELLKSGVPPRSSLVTFVWNSIEWALLLWCAAKMQITFVPLDANALNRKEETKYVLDLLSKNCAPSMIAVADSVMANTFDSLGFKSTAPLTKIVTNSTENELSGSPETIPVRHSNYALHIRHDWPPKGMSAFAGKPFYRIACNVISRRIDSSTRFLIQSSNFRVICLNTTIATWRSNGCIVFASPEPDVSSTLRMINPFECTHMLCVPSKVYEIANHPEFDQYRPSCLKVLSLAGDVITEKLVDFAKDALRPELTLNSWGMTEGTGTLGWLPGERIKSLNGIPGVGKALRGTKVRICKPDTHQAVPFLEVGELHLGGSLWPIVIQHYIEDRDADSFYEDEGGRWFITGDRAVMDREGVVYVLGRFKDVIKRGGLGLSPSVIEGCINKQQGIVESQVVALPDKVSGSLPVAILAMYVDSTQELDPSSLQAAIARELGKEHVPVHIFTLQELDLPQFPTSAAGKVMKMQLSELVQRKLVWSKSAKNPSCRNEQDECALLRTVT